VKRTQILELATFMVCLSFALQAQSRPRITQPIFIRSHMQPMIVGAWTQTWTCSACCWC
jgi:hypothetical protein